MHHEGAQHNSWRRLSVCVDDFGLHEGVNRAVFSLMEKEKPRVQAVSAMVGAKAWPCGAALLRQCDAAQIEVGLHLSLTECTLEPQSCFGLSALISRAYGHWLDRGALQREIAAQFDAFEQAMGRRPAYVDGHQHIHQLPVVRELLLAQLQQRYGQEAVSLWLRSTRSAARFAHADLATALKSRVIAALGQQALARRAKGQGLRQNTHLLGVYDFKGSVQNYQERLLRWLRAAQDGDLLMCHVGLGDPQEAASPRDVLAGVRSKELAVFSAPAWQEWLDAAQIHLQPMGTILR